MEEGESDGEIKKGSVVRRETSSPRQSSRKQRKEGRN